MILDPVIGKEYYDQHVVPEVERLEKLGLRVEVYEKDPANKNPSHIIIRNPVERTNLHFYGDELVKDILPRLYR